MIIYFQYQQDMIYSIEQIINKIIFVGKISQNGIHQFVYQLLIAIILFILIVLILSLSMVLPLIKVLSLVIRVFSRPLINYTKQVHLKSDTGSTHPLLRSCFIYLGNRYNIMQTWVNRKFMKIQTKFAYKPLNDELALEKGIQFFYEIVFYSIIIGLPLYEMIQASNQSKIKNKLLQQKIKGIEQQIQQLGSKYRGKRQSKQINNEDAKIQKIQYQQNIQQKQKTVETKTTVQSKQMSNSMKQEGQSSTNRAKLPYYNIRIVFPNEAAYHETLGNKRKAGTVLPSI